MNKGYTLIELLVVATIIILLSGTALVTFTNYRERRAVQVDANAVAERLRTIQTKATAVEIPSGCTTVTSYVVTLSGANLTAEAVCPGVGSVAIPSLSLTMASSTFGANSTITFSSRTVTANAVTLCISGNNNTFKVEVNAAANVSKPTYSAVCP